MELQNLNSRILGCEDDLDGVLFRPAEKSILSVNWIHFVPILIWTLNLIWIKIVWILNLIWIKIVWTLNLFFFNQISIKIEITFLELCVTQVSFCWRSGPRPDQVPTNYEKLIMTIKMSPRWAFFAWYSILDWLLDWCPIQLVPFSPFNWSLFHHSTGPFY